MSGPILRRPALALLLALAACPISAPAHAEQLSEIFERANTHAFEGRHGEAIAEYERLVDAGVDDADVYYNLGYAHAQLDQLGHAVLNFERAARLVDDADVELALARVRETLGSRAADRDGEALVQTRPPLLEALVEPLSEPLLAWSVLALTWLLFGALALRSIPALRARLGLGLGVTAGLAALLLAAATLGLLVRTDALADGERAVVVESAAELLEGPDSRAKSRGTLAEGGLARVVAREGEWVRIRSDRGLDGWTRADVVGLVRIRN